MKTLLQGISHLIAPRVCHVCGQTLGANEEIICLGCYLDLPRTGVHKSQFNDIHQRLGHQCKVDQAAGWFYYKRQSPYAKLLVDAKYGHLPRLAMKLGEECASELAKDRFFDCADMIVPMPLHWRKRMQRGYNQAYEISLGLSEVSGLPIVNAMKVTKSHGVQSRHNREERFASISGTIGLRHAEALRAKRVLVVDDIITTGASMAEAVKTVWTAGPISVSVLCLGLTAHY